MYNRTFRGTACKDQGDIRKVAVLKSANMSMGINLLEKLLKEAAGLLAEAGYDIEIVEKHHKLKKDAPSGTALALGDAINEGLSENMNMYLTEAREAFRVRRRRSVFLLSEAVRSLEIMM